VDEMRTLVLALPDGKLLFFDGKSSWQLKKKRRKLKQTYPSFTSLIIKQNELPLFLNVNSPAYKTLRRLGWL